MKGIKLETEQKLELKIIALKEGFKTKVASLLDEYEERIAVLRIELTEQNQQLQAFRDERENLQRVIQELQQRVNDLEPKVDGDVQEETPTNEAD